MDQKVTVEHLVKIAKLLPKWKPVIKLLGLKGQEVKDIEDKYRDGEDQRSEALEKWVRKEGSQATYSRIYEVLCELEEREAAEEVMALVSPDGGHGAHPKKTFTDCGKEFEKPSKVLNNDDAEVPNMKTLMSYVGDKCAPDWHRLGLELDIPVSDLDIIESDHSNKCQDAMRKTLQKWLDISHNPTWKQIVTALQRMNKNAIARNIEKDKL